MPQTTLADIRRQYPQYDDLSDDDLADALHGRFYSDMPREQFNERIGLRSGREAASRAYVENAPRSGPFSYVATGLQEAFNASDELLATGARIDNFIDNRLMGDRQPDADPRRVAEIERERLQRARAEQPLRQGLREGVGALPTALAGGAGFRGAVAGGAAAGGTLGAFSGETAQERAVGAGAGAAVGGVLGAAADQAGRAIGRATSPLARAVQRRLSGEGGNMTRAQRRAFAELRNAFREEGMDGGQVRDVLRRYAESGFDDATLLDAASPGGPVQRAIRAAGTRGGDAGRQLESQLQQRLETQADRVGRQLSRRLSGAGDFTEQAEALVRERARRAAPLYRQAFFVDGPRGGGVGPEDMARLSRQADMAAPSVDDALAAARQLRSGGPRQGETLSQLVRRMGGVSDDRGDILAAAGSPQRAASIVRASGRQIDDLAQAAAEAGFFINGRPSRREFLDALSRDLSGDPVRALDDLSDFDRAGLDQMREWFERNGVDWSNTNERQLREQIVQAFAPEEQASAGGADVARVLREQILSGADESAELVTMPRARVERVLVRVPRRARAVAERLARAEGRGLGSLDGDEIAVRDLHFVKMGLDDIISGSRRGQNSIGNTERRALMQVRDDLRQAMPQAYREATDAFAGDSALIDALEAGRSALRGDAEAVEGFVASMTDGERQMFRAGLVRAAREQVERAPDNSDVVRRVIGNEDRRRRLMAAFDDPVDFAQFEQALRNEQARVRNARFVAPSTGSQTAPRGVDAQEEGAGLLNDLLNFDFARALGRVGRVGRQAASGARRRATDRELIAIATRAQNAATPDAQALIIEQAAQEYGEEAAQRIRDLVVSGAIPAGVVAAN